MTNAADSRVPTPTRYLSRNCNMKWTLRVVTRIWRAGDLLLPLRATSSCHRCRSKAGWRDRQVLSGCKLTLRACRRRVNGQSRTSICSIASNFCFRMQWTSIAIGFPLSPLLHDRLHSTRPIDHPMACRSHESLARAIRPRTHRAARSWRQRRFQMTWTTMCSPAHLWRDG